MSTKKIIIESKDTKTRAGIIIRLAGTDKFLTEIAWGKYAPNNYRDIVKGHLSQGESLKVGACREAFEETGIQINPEDLAELGIYSYGGGDLHIFYVEKSFDISRCHCSSTFINKWDKEVPEVRNFELISLYDNIDSLYFHKGLRPILKKEIKKILGENKHDII